MERVTPDKMKGKYVNCYVDHLTRYVSGLKFADGQDILDVACGTGYGMSLLSSVAKSITGIDYSEEALAYAKPLKYFCPVKLVKLDLEKEDIPGLYSYIVSFETIEHLESPSFFLNQIKGILTSNGIFYFSIPLGDYEDHFHKQTYVNTKDVFKLIQPIFGYVDYRIQTGENGDNKFFIGFWRKNWE